MVVKNTSNLKKYLPLAVLVALAGCSPQEPSVSFSSDIQPVLKNNCLACHQKGGQGYEKTGLDMTSYEGLLKGTNFGAIIEPGNSVSSTIMRLIEGRADKSINMPHGENKPLSQVEIDLIKKWIDQGANNN